MLVTPQRLAGYAVDMGEAIDAAASEDSVNGRRGQPQAAGDLRRTESEPPPQRDDALLHRLGRLVRDPVGSARPVLHPRFALGPVTGRPFAGGDGRDHGHLRGGRDRVAAIDDQAREAKPRAQGEDSVSVGHEGLLGLVKR